MNLGIDYFKLVGRKIVKCTSEQEGMEQFGPSRLLFHTGNADLRVSTVFLVFDHGHGFTSKPLLFETMVFGGAFDREMERYCTYDEAEYGHKAWVAKVFPALVRA